MKTFNFFKIGEDRVAKKEQRKPRPVFGITSDAKTISGLIKRYDLEEAFIWIEQ